MIHLKIGGVPEHFNLPWHQGFKQKNFEKIGVKLEWVEFKGGTGTMNTALRENSIDIAVMLTEGIVYDIIKGNPSKIIAQYISTPLQWGIYTGINNPLHNVEDIFTKKFAISREGSGSHLMPLIDAAKNNKTIDHSQFVVIRNLEGALQSLSSLESDVFYWERYTTKPFVDQKILKYIGKSPTPWPAFVIVARNEVIEQYPDKLKAIVETVLTLAQSFKKTASSIDLICKRHYLNERDAQKWMNETNWSIDGNINEHTIQQVIQALIASSLIENKEYLPSIFLNK
ncbi:MAG: PhnD/SsuA/transferrin family substrate-binding protein [Bacteroidota bacterium]